MDNSSAPVRLNEKWIVTIIWLALLLLLYFTSANGVLAGFGGNLRNFYASVSGSTQAFEITTMAISTAIVMLLAGIALVYELYQAWFQFVELTNTFLISFVKRSDPGETNPIFFEFLNFKTPEKVTENEDESIVTDPDEATGSLIGNILKAVAICWMIIILTPGIIAVVSMIIR